MLQISRKVEYALRAAIHLAGLPPDVRASFREIAEEQDAPPEFLAKILRSMVEAGIADSARGPNGGFALARPAAEISFLDVIEAAEGPISINICTSPTDVCALSVDCSMQSVWQRGQDAMLSVFRDTSLANVMPTDPVRLYIQNAAAESERSGAATDTSA